MDASPAQLLDFQMHGQDIPALLGHWADRRPDHPALVWDPGDGEGRTWTYAELLADVHRLAAGLADRGIAIGDKVLIHSENCPEMVLAFLACATVGAVAVTTNTKSVTSEMAFYASKAQCVAAITQPEFAAMVAEAAPTLKWIAVDFKGNTSAVKTQLFSPDVSAPGGASGTVPATLTLTLGAPAQFGAFTPGITKTYFASSTATVTSTAGDALLSVADPSSVGTGHLVNGSFVLPEPLQARARNAANSGTAYNNVGSSASPLNLLTWSAPVSNDAVTLEYSQLVKSTDPLRTGSYAKTLTFTLSTTTP